MLERILTLNGLKDGKDTNLHSKSLSILANQSKPLAFSEA